MKIPLAASYYKKWFIAGLLVQLIAAWFSVGYHHHDEHFQVLEFCNYKMGFSPASQLPWEFAAKCRPALQPFMAYCLCRTLVALGLYNPFRAAFLLRLGMGVLTWLVTCRMVLLLLDEFVTKKGRLVFVWCSFLFWFVPYIGVRFSAENISGLLFLLAVSVILVLPEYGKAKRYIMLAVTGLLLGFTLFLRLQMAFAFAGLGLWLLVYAKWHLRDWLLLSIAGIAAIGLCIVVDHWFYGVWVFTPYNYYSVNIVQHIAAKFGVAPWWNYFVLFTENAVPPLSLVLLPLFFMGLWKRPRHIFTWICIVFIAGHCLIGHKEMRFLLPVSFAFIFLVCSAADNLLQQYPGNKLIRMSLPVLAWCNAILLVVKIFTPAHEAVNYYRFIYNQARQKPTTLVCYKESPYHLIGLEMNFYKPEGLDIVVTQNADDIRAVLNRKDGRSVLFLNPEITPIPVIAALQKERMYCLLPDWPLINVNDWESRSYIWSIYSLLPPAVK